MKLLYISSDVSAIHHNLLKAINKQGIDSILGTYTIQKDAKLHEHNSNSWAFKSNSPFKGPVLYFSRLNEVLKYYISRIQAEKIDITHGNMMFGDGYLCRKIYEKTGVPYVLSVRNTDLNLWFLWKLPWIKAEGIKNLLSAKAIIFLSTPYKDLLLKRIPANKRELIAEKCAVVPNGIDDFWLKNKTINNKRIDDYIKFITVGRIEKNKNQVAVAEAISLLIKKREIRASYSAIGDSRDKDMEEALSKHSFVEMIPYMEKEQLIHKFRENHIYVMPSHTETFGLVYAEAMTQGLPVVYTRGQGFDEQFPDGFVGHSVDSRNVESILDGIEHTIDNYSEIATNAYNNCEKFTWEKVSKQLQKIYETALSH